ncbi:PREDICTED: uncharacterized protein LOC109583989 [Amphimedon queenslandica]|uniref:G-protein coupled receptors family 2 profile 1 domain-containing protein n=1 Tax=Amphimedon queenslandica TaxID=400682 RepID=A0AAN0JDM7_AMPQE|nr:PREDICTED: uncharacterized protein LOC109583989 [Amphimedon queenslandica]|eukprot:XP_019855104.1 PREDICTED: uncharacterized protein LOC109583989 [Amphimedon queenslandica]
MTSVTGFCNQSQTESLDFGAHTWPESVGNTILTMPCGNRPLMNVTRMCQTNGVGWGNPDYSQCETSTCENDTIVTNRGTFQWPITPVESLADLPCPHGPNGARAIRQCRRNGVWDTHDISNCTDPRITAAFASIADTNVTVENVVEVAQNLSEVVMLASQPGDQNEINLRNVSSLLIQTANLFSSPDIIIMLSTEEVSMTTESTIEILNSIQEWPPQVIAAQSNNIVQSFERIVGALISQENFTNLTIIETGIAFQGLRVS